MRKTLCSGDGCSRWRRRSGGSGRARGIDPGLAFGLASRADRGRDRGNASYYGYGYGPGYYGPTYCAPGPGCAL